jgi:hypothetical protein
MSVGRMLSGSVGLEHLQSEPGRLRSEAERLNVELEALVLENYRVFVRNLSVSSQLRVEGERLGDVVRDMKRSLTGLEISCGDFKATVDPLLNSHKRNRKTLKYQMELIELLEVPQLVDACARNGFHEEALELACFVNSLEKRNLLAYEVRSDGHPTRRGGNVVCAIADDVHKTLYGLRDTLLDLLRDHDSIARHLGTLAIIRKLDSFLVDRQLSLERFTPTSAVAGISDQQRESLRASLLQSAETKLQMEFLEARTAWMQTHGEATGRSQDDARPADASDPGPYSKAIEMLEVNRATWFSISTAFNALFEETTGTCPSSSVLGCWMTRQVDSMLAQLRAHALEIEDGVSLKSVVEQSLHFGRRMGQIGCDFSALVLPLFEECMMIRLQKRLRDLKESFKNIIINEKLAIMDEVGNINSEQIIPLFSIQDEALDKNDDPSTAPSPEIAAPLTLLQFPPLGFLLNALLTDLNYFRECPFRNIQPLVVEAVMDCLRSSAEILVQDKASIRLRGAKYISGGVNLDEQYYKETSTVLFPHAVFCLELMTRAPHVTITENANSWSLESQGYLQALQATLA